jgi:hypothetical protein
MILEIEPMDSNTARFQFGAVIIGPMKKRRDFDILALLPHFGHEVDQQLFSSATDAYSINDTQYTRPDQTGDLQRSGHELIPFFWLQRQLGLSVQGNRVKKCVTMG